MLVSLACLRAGSLRQRGLGAEGAGQASSVALGQPAARRRGGSGGRGAWPRGLSALCLGTTGCPFVFRTSLPAQPPRPRATERDGEQTWGCQRKISGTGPPQPPIFPLVFRPVEEGAFLPPALYTEQARPALREWGSNGALLFVLVPLYCSRGPDETLPEGKKEKCAPPTQEVEEGQCTQSPSSDRLMVG